jgi:regulator of PEP synthase PpsR (kinase-PPPase family)
MHTRTVFFISDGTGITAETFGNAILAQFEFTPGTCDCRSSTAWTRRTRWCGRSTTREVEGRKPVVFTTLVNVEILKVIEDGCKGMLLDMFGTFVGRWRSSWA